MCCKMEVHSWVMCLSLDQDVSNSTLRKVTLAKTESKWAKSYFTQIRPRQ
jgi:hypothetical protein